MLEIVDCLVFVKQSVDFGILKLWNVFTRNGVNREHALCRIEILNRMILVSINTRIVCLLLGYLFLTYKGKQQ